MQVLAVITATFGYYIGHAQAVVEAEEKARVKLHACVKVQAGVQAAVIVIAAAAKFNIPGAAGVGIHIAAKPKSQVWTAARKKANAPPYTAMIEHIQWNFKVIEAY